MEGRVLLDCMSVRVLFVRAGRQGPGVLAGKGPAPCHVRKETGETAPGSDGRDQRVMQAQARGLTLKRRRCS